MRGGSFWIALLDGRVVGTISLLDVGDRQGALLEMFVKREFRGAALATATLLLETLLVWARARGFREIFLGTTAKFLAAHRFYEKNGFSEIDESSLPAAFPIMAVATRFFSRRLADLEPSR